MNSIPICPDPRWNCSRSLSFLVTYTSAEWLDCWRVLLHLLLKPLSYSRCHRSFQAGPTLALLSSPSIKVYHHPIYWWFYEILSNLVSSFLFPRSFIETFQSVTIGSLFFRERERESTSFVTFLWTLSNVSLSFF